MATYFTRSGRLFVRGTPIERVLAHVEAASSGCWLWTGADNGHGYASVPVKGRRAYAHRISYEHFIGPIPEGLELDHLCEHERCANPTHLEPVTTQENMRRRVIRSTTCRRGHSRTPENVYLRPDGKGRHCRACERERNGVQTPLPPGGKTHCVRGHARVPSNVYADGHCKECHRMTRKALAGTRVRRRRLPEEAQP